MKSGSFVLFAAMLASTSALGAQVQDAAAFTHQAEAAASNGKSAEAIAFYTSAIGLKPNDPDLYFGRAEAYRLAENFVKARDDYSQAFALNADDSEALRGRGWMKQKLGDVIGGDADMAEARHIDKAAGR